MVGGLLVHEQNGPPSLAVGVLPMVMSSVDTAPFGLGHPTEHQSVPSRSQSIAELVRAERGVSRCPGALAGHAGAPSDGPDQLVAVNHVTRSTFYLRAIGTGVRAPAQRPRR